MLNNESKTSLATNKDKKAVPRKLPPRSGIKTSQKVN